jgi:hypothetical protein
MFRSTCATHSHMQQQEGYPSTTHLQKGRNRRGTYQGAWNFTKAFLLPLLSSNVSRVSSVAPPSKHNWSWQDSKRGGRRYNLHGGALFMMGGRRMAQSKWPEIVGFYSSFQPGVQNGISQITWRSPNSPTVLKLRCVATVPTVLEYIIRELY